MDKTTYFLSRATVLNCSVSTVYLIPMCDFSNKLNFLLHTHCYGLFYILSCPGSSIPHFEWIKRMTFGQWFQKRPEMTQIFLQKKRYPNNISSGFNALDMFSMYVWHVHNVETLLKLVLDIWGRQFRTFFWNYCPIVIKYWNKPIIKGGNTNGTICFSAELRVILPHFVSKDVCPT